MITATGLTKCYGNMTAVDDLTFEVRPGIVTGARQRLAGVIDRCAS